MAALICSSFSISGETWFNARAVRLMFDTEEHLSGELSAIRVCPSTRKTYIE